MNTKIKVGFIVGWFALLVSPCYAVEPAGPAPANGQTATVNPEATDDTQNSSTPRGEADFIEEGPLSEATVDHEADVGSPSSGEGVVILAEKKEQGQKARKLPPVKLPPKRQRLIEVTDGDGNSIRVDVDNRKGKKTRYPAGSNPLERQQYIRIVTGPDGTFIIEFWKDGKLHRVIKGKLKTNPQGVVTGIESDEKMPDWDPKDWEEPKEPRNRRGR